MKICIYSALPLSLATLKKVHSQVLTGACIILITPLSYLYENFLASLALIEEKSEAENEAENEERKHLLIANF